MTIGTKEDTNISNEIEIRADVRPMLLFIKLLDSILQASKRRFNFSDFGFELARIETDFSATSADKLTVIFYPSDAFLRFAVTLCAGNFNL